MGGGVTHSGSDRGTATANGERALLTREALGPGSECQRQEPRVKHNLE